MTLAQNHVWCLVTLYRVTSPASSSFFYCCVVPSLISCTHSWSLTHHHLSSAVDIRMTAENTTETSVEICLETRYWFYFLSSSFVVFLAGLIAILSWRIFDHFVGCSQRLAARASRRTRRNTGNKLSFTQDDAETGVRIGITTKIKWKCEKLISGQTFFGRIMVSPFTWYRVWHSVYLHVRLLWTNNNDEFVTKISRRLQWNRLPIAVLTTSLED